MANNPNGNEKLCLGRFTQYDKSGDFGVTIANKIYKVEAGFTVTEPFEVNFLILGGLKFEPGLSLPVFSKIALKLARLPYQTEIVMEASQIIQEGVVTYVAPLWGLADDFFTIYQRMKKMPIYALGVRYPGAETAKNLDVKTRNIKVLVEKSREVWRSFPPQIQRGLTPRQLFVLWKFQGIKKRKQSWIKLNQKEVAEILKL